MAKVTEYEIIPHGWEHAQYFQGCGVAFTKFKHVATGAGHTAKEAYDHAAEQIAMRHDANNLPKRPRGIRARDHVPATHCGEDSEFHWYVSIRYNVKEDK